MLAFYLRRAAGPGSCFCLAVANAADKTIAAAYSRLLVPDGPRGLPLALGLPLYALVSVILYAGTALLRVQVENSALAGAPEGRPSDGVQTTP
jgi:hypothetical protein